MPAPGKEKVMPVPPEILSDNPAWPKLPSETLAQVKKLRPDENSSGVSSMHSRRIVCVVKGKRLLPRKSMFDPKPFFSPGQRILVSYANEESNTQGNWFRATVLRTLGESNRVAEGELYILSCMLVLFYFVEKAPPLLTPLCDDFLLFLLIWSTSCLRR